MSSSGGAWAVEFDRPSHFLASGAPTGATLLKRWHLRVMGHALVSVPCWEWDRCKGACERKQYLRGKLEAKPRHERVIQQAEFVSEKHHQHREYVGDDGEDPDYAAQGDEDSWTEVAATVLESDSFPRHMFDCVRAREFIPGAGTALASLFPVPAAAAAEVEEVHA